MTTPNDDLPLDNRTGNLYDPLFARRIDALGKSSAKPPAPNRPNGNGAGWPVGVLVVMLFVIVRGCSTLSTSNSRSSYDFKPHDNTELLKRLDQENRNAVEEFRRNQEQMDRLKVRKDAPAVIPDEPGPGP